MQSSTMNAEAVASMGNKKGGNAAKNTETKEAGRKELPDDQKSAKTIQNKESMS
jgi:hypothetical protein